MKLPRTPFLNRFTSLPVLIDILTEKRLVLLDPNTWEDRNDGHYIKRYKKKKKLNTVLALCFSSTRETFHHWKVFSYGTSGVCVEFDKPKLMAGIEGIEGFRAGKVQYKLIQDIVERTPKVDEWPFLKRIPFKAETEFRIIYEHESEEHLSFPLTIPLNAIRRITLSPWLHRSIVDSVRKTLRSIPGCSNLRIRESTLLETSQWKEAIA